ncbi:ribosomal protein S18-alanine N-acetyltransferase [Methanohalophilus profundi]|uniref:ribosomal protein S18-alanine N-acetyltransferase n=1 Tax=Methanohalophilus profundi TaxID=2138083 RepID=UPI00101D3319|nr:ribosomal protein S18-alanine N-acetyltransferase [Methanohalophilus profundi]
MLFRKFEGRDFAEVLQIEMEAFEDHDPYTYMDFYEMNPEGFLVAESGKTITGFVMGYRSSEQEGRIFSLAVKKEFRRRGIGQALLQVIQRHFRNRNVKYMRLEVRASNKKARSLYSRMGFVDCWYEPGYYIDGGCGIIMKKYLYPVGLHEDLMADDWSAIS